MEASFSELVAPNAPAKCQLRVPLGAAHGIPRVAQVHSYVHGFSAMRSPRCPQPMTAVPAGRPSAGSYQVEKGNPVDIWGFP